METKYLSDGRKVVVLGKLNSQEMIVQEVFVTKSGDEIPSGESFTTKSLHDEPVLSWQKKEEQRLKSRMESIKKAINDEELNLKKAKKKTKAYQEQLKQVSLLIENFDESKLETLVQFMTGSIKYLVNDSYSISDPVDMMSEIAINDSWGIDDGIKLCSVLGKSNGDLTYKINRYSDGSGGYHEVYPFTNYEDAIDHIKKRAEKKIEENRLSSKDYKKCSELGIEFSDFHQRKYIEHTNKNIKESISKKKEEIKKEEDALKKLESELIK